MKIRMYCRYLKSGSIVEDHELNLGQYNEYYLGALTRDQEIWVIVTDDDGVETKLHLKR